MNSQTQSIQALAELKESPFIDDNGLLPHQYDRKIGAYAIYSEPQKLRHLGYSRNVLLSLKQHLVRKPKECYWAKVLTIDKPSKQALEAILKQWGQEYPNFLYSDANSEETWTQSIHVKDHMTPEEQAELSQLQGNELGTVKHLKRIARRIESEILSTLEARGFKDELRFNPKLKEAGLLDVK